MVATGSIATARVSPILPRRIPKATLSNRMKVAVRWLFFCAFEHTACISSGRAAIVLQCDACGCVSNLAATSVAPEFGVCPRLLFWCVHQNARCSVVFCCNSCPSCNSPSLSGGIAFIALRLCRRSAAEWHNSILANACVPRGGWSLPHKIEVCASLLSEFTYGFLLYLLHLCSGPVFATGAKSRHALPVFFFPHCRHCGFASSIWAYRTTNFLCCMVGAAGWDALRGLFVHPTAPCR